MSRHRLALLCCVSIVAAGGVVALPSIYAAPAGSLTGQYGPPASPADAQAVADRLFKAYLSMSTFLSRDAAPDAAVELQAIHHAAHRLTDVGDEKVAPVAERIAKVAHEKVTGLEPLRQAFKTISPAMIELAHLLPPTSTVAPGLRHFTCSMEKADWLQTGGKTANPYLGAAMSTCGKLVESIVTKPAPSK